MHGLERFLTGLDKPDLSNGRYSEERVSQARASSDYMNARDPEFPKCYEGPLLRHNQACEDLDRLGLPFTASTTNVFLVAEKIYYWPTSGKFRFKGRRPVYRTKSTDDLLRYL